MTRFVDVAVPLPLPEALTYEVPEAFEAIATPGSRARIRVGRRRLVGMVVAPRAEPPQGVEVRALQAILDCRPVLSDELLRLATEAARYYMAPIGEVIRSMVPAALPTWGDQRIWLTDAGALSPPRSAREEQLIEVLRARGRIPIVDLAALLGAEGLENAIERLHREGRVAISADSRRGARYHAAVELAAADTQELLERCGRSLPGRQAVELLAALGRPATVTEVCETVGCGPAVLRRLVSLGVLRRFTQISRLSLDRHVLEPAGRPPVALRPDQDASVEALERSLDEPGYSAFLLTGITGSGKTEVYLRAAEKAVREGGSAIILVPEIALVPAVAGSARERFGDRTAVFHSGLSGLERQQEWERIRSGEARVVLGPRSAVFAPAGELRIIVVDEEQDASYKQDHVPRYHGRDMAILRAHQAGAVAVLVSATPSLEARHNVEIGKISRLSLTQRVGNARLPAGELVDLRREPATRRPGEIHFSARLCEEMSRTLDRGEQIILLRNRRGYAPLLLCRACGDDSRCRDCGLPRTYHRREGRLRCHYCGSSTTAPRTCPACAADALEAVGSGTERVEETVAGLFPEAKAEVLDRDTTRRGEAAAVLARFGRGDSRILIGTQMVSKGHHFPRVTLTAVLLADTYLSFPDFRSVERTYGLLTQLAGRAGRGDIPGRVIIQTFHPEHYAIQAALRHDDDRFATEEMRFRRIFHYPPYTRMIQILLRDTNRRRAERKIEALGRRLARDPAARGVRISGPAPAPFEKLRGRWRFQILLRHRSSQRLRDLLAAVLPSVGRADMVIDVDPHELL